MKQIKEKGVLNMQLSKELLNKIDEFKVNNGFTTRTNAVIHLLIVALRELEGRSL